MIRALLAIALLAPACGRTVREDAAAIAGDAATPTAAPTLADARAFQASQPEYLRPHPHAATPPGLPDVRSETCGACHVDFYAEWQLSTHAQAWTGDPQFQAELHKSRTANGDAGWMCVQCHTPLENQLPQLVARIDGALNRPVYVDNPDFDPLLQDDAIGCATCHVRDGVVVGPFGDTAAPHATRKDDRLQAEPLCLRCHEAAATFPDIGLACAFETGTEWRASSYAPDQPCQTCHMPAVDRPLVPGGPPRATRRHWFGGSLVPKTPAMAEALAPLVEVFGTGVDARWVDPAPVPGQPATLTFAVANARAGHRLPTGDPERFLKIRAEVLGPGGVVAEREERIGQTWSWWPEPKRLDDNRLLPGEERTWTLDVPIWPDGGRARLTVEHWRISAENVAFHHLEGAVVPSRVVARVEFPQP